MLCLGRQRAFAVLAVVFAAALLPQAVADGCAAACDVNSCVRESTGGGYRCVRCKDGWTLRRDTGTCGCPRGKYGSGTEEGGCAECPIGSYCAGGTITGTDFATPAKVDCSSHSAGLTTLGTRSISSSQCVNQPGYSWSLDAGLPKATACAPGSYCSGLRRQPACSPCSPGMVTNETLLATDASACLVPPGSYMTSPGILATCPQGEYKAGYGLASSCSACIDGVTTASVGSTSADACTYLLPGYYATARQAGGQITAVRLCKQDHICPGGLATAAWDGEAALPGGAQVAACAGGRWTKGAGSTSAAQCAVPPGYSATPSAISECPDGLYREGWSSAATVACATCSGEVSDVAGLSSERLLPVRRLAADNSAASPAMLRGSRTSCFISRGQGIYQNGAGTFRAANCTTGFGVPSKAYGVSVNPCRDCPAGMTASNLAWRDNTTLGFFDPLACTTDPGTGYESRSSQECAEGSYNVGGTSYEPCTSCGYGLSSPAGSDASSDCVLQARYGVVSGEVVLCPVGTYNAVNRTNATSPCDTCPANSTTSDEGQTTCSVCLPGFGGASSCSGECGGGAATYGASTRSGTTACASCPTMTAGYTFNYSDSTNEYDAASVAPSQAAHAAQCLPAWSQTVDTAFWVPPAPGAGAWAYGAASRQNNLGDCLATCGSGCMIATFNYSSESGDNCFTFQASAANMTETNRLGLKVAAAGSVPASGPPLPSGRYVHWRTTNTLSVLGDTLSSPTSVTYLECLALCDAQPECFGVRRPVSVGLLAAGDCTLLKGVSTVAGAAGRRSLIRTDLAYLLYSSPGSGSLLDA